MISNLRKYGEKLVNSVLCLMVYCHNSNIHYKTIETPNGAVRGILNKTNLNQVEYYSFRGIPYAKPPIGNLRFKKPEPIEPWKSRIIDAFDYGPACSQIPNFITDTKSSEDCLFVNVFVPAISKYKKLPVMVFLFGGQFLGGSGDDHSNGPDMLVEGDIILVTLNYRVGLFGFMSLGTPEYSGNMGLKDQQLALKWTYDNIEFFGGDNTKITLGGHSAGSMSVTYHLLNEESRRYFQQSLSMSATAQMNGAYFKGNHRCLIEKFVMKYNQSIGDDINEITNFMKNVSAEKINDFSMEVRAKFSEGNNIFVPTVEGKRALQPFITEDPDKKFRDMNFKNISSYYTHTNRESVPSVDEPGPNYLNSTIMDAFLNDFWVFLPIRGYDISISKKPYLKSLMNEFRDFYFANTTTNYDRVIQLFTMLSDLQFTMPMDIWVRKQVNVSRKNVFYHEFSVDSKLKWFKRAIDVPGAVHVDDLCFVFWCRDRADIYQNIMETKNYNSSSLIAWNTLQYMTTLFTNFVKYGKPSVGGNPVKGFKPAEMNSINILNITNNGLITGGTSNDQKFKFYEYFSNEGKRLVEEHGDVPTNSVVQRFCDKFAFTTLDNDSSEEMKLS